MNKFFVLCACVVLAQSFVSVAFADEDFYGIIESRPAGKVGTWVVGGRSVEVTETVKLDDDEGPLTVGACVEVDIDNGIVEEIESEPPRKCTK